MNVLLTCAGRRNYLVECFRTALGGRGLVLACDSSGSAPALAEADRSYVVPTIGRSEYYDTLLSICRDQQVGLLVSVYDLELRELARRAPRFQAGGTLVAISAPETIALCHDKWTTYRFLRSCNIATPATYVSLEAARRALQQNLLSYPLVLKPRWGTSSIGLMYAENERELTLAYAWGRLQVSRSIITQMSGENASDDLVIQECIQGQEYGMDIVNDFEGRHRAVIARRKLAMRAGNTDRAITVSDPLLERIGMLIGEQLQHFGSVDCDVIVRDDECHVLDINPRLGGGYPFSHMAGANLPAALIAWACGEEPDPAWLRARPGVLVAKYDGMIAMDRTSVSVISCAETVASAPV